MVKNLIHAILSSGTHVAFAEEPTDTIGTQELNEVVIQAPKVIRKADMDDRTVDACILSMRITIR